MSVSKNILFILICGIFLMYLSGCENKGTAERAGDNLGKALNSVGEEADQAASNVKKAIE